MCVCDMHVCAQGCVFARKVGSACLPCRPWALGCSFIYQSLERVSNEREVLEPPKHGRERRLIQEVPCGIIGGNTTNPCGIIVHASERARKSNIHVLMKQVYVGYRHKQKHNSMQCVGCGIQCSSVQYNIPNCCHVI